MSLSFLLLFFDREKDVFGSYKDFPNKYKLKYRGENGKG